MEKKCFKCSQVKPLSCYYKHPKTGDGHLGKCMDCTKSDTKARHDILKTNPEWCNSEKKRHREKYYRLGYKEKHKPTHKARKKIMDNYYTRYPEKKSAKNACSSLPGVDGKQKHHWSYCKEHRKDLVYLTQEEHNKAHRYMAYDQERMMYREMDGTLLDTKQKHLLYLNSLDTRA